MEGCEVIPPQSSAETDEPQKTLAETLEELCAFYLMIGVDYDEFWHGDYTRLKFYVRAYQLRQERGLEKANETAYLEGLYNYNAFSSVMSAFGWGLGGKKGKQPDGYLEAPIPLTEREKKADDDRKREKTIKWFMAGQKGGKGNAQR